MQYRPKRQFARQWFLKWLLKPPYFYNNGTCSSPWSLHEAGFTITLCEVMSKRGSLIIEENASNANLIELIAEIMHVPYISLPGINLAILTKSSDAQSLLDLPLSLSEKVNPLSIAAHIESQSQVPFTKQDITKLAESFAQFYRKRLDLGQRVYLALKSIGHPAHYSEITEIHNTLFPDRHTSERNIHAALNREQYGVVWIGIRGTFALKEWGYERPSQSLYEAVTEIVQRKFRETSQPVPFTVIVSEISKYRKVVKPSSLIFAIHCNPKLQRVSRDSFILKDSGSQDQQNQEEITLDELDKILKEFEKAE
jgi:Ca2+-binding EF-hand superfamily protein